MMYLDTHAVVWLYESKVERFTQKAQQLLEKHELFISPMVELELAYLHEIKRLTVKPNMILDELQKSIYLAVSEHSLASIIKNATKLCWTRDPFDRVIVAEALLDDALLLTKDHAILKHYSQAVW